ncbi:protein disulfide-isomerase A4 [Galendromus occidentalis]|uniref:protein disulfide-isomerase n=1 Tax=Galendromus occidentalis TaxID=34638 RepID=A0AAJ6QP60_9ACAR|nr:protein disulfide-isomerase A4 [Galendromus occidentalis]
MRWWHFTLFCACSASFCEASSPEPKVAEKPGESIPIVDGHGGTIDIKVDSDVLMLTEDNFDIIVNAKPIILVNFFVPWCVHCQKLAPEYAKAANRLKGNDKIPRIPLAKVDCNSESALARRFGIAGYPTLLIFQKGQHKEYEGGMTSDALIEEMRKLTDPDYKPPPPAVKVLTSQNFTSVLSRVKLALVEFYAPWCGHCKQLEPELERAARNLEERVDPIPIYKIDAIAEKDIAKALDIPGYPTMFVIRYGIRFRYDGPREDSGIAAYMIQQGKSPSEYLERQPQLKNEVKWSRFPLVVGAFQSLKSKFFETFIEAANFERGNFSFVHTDKFDVVNAVLGVKQMDTIALLQPEWLRSPYETVRLIYTNSKAKSQDLRDWYHAHCVPLVGHRTKENLWMYNKYPMVVAYYDVNFSHEYRAETQIPRRQMLSVAKDFRDYHPEHKLVFAISDEDDFYEELKLLKLADSPTIVNVGFYMSPKERYAMEPVEDFDDDSLRKFIDDVLEKKLKPIRKSQLAPKKQSGAARIVVGSSFEKEIINEDKDVFILFYAPDCGHCKNFMPDFKKIAKKYQDSDLKVAKIDASNNEFPDEFVVTGYPTLFYVPAKDKKNPIKFVGERNLSNVLDFIEKHRAHGKGENAPEGQEVRKDEL